MVTALVIVSTILVIALLFLFAAADLVVKLSAENQVFKRKLSDKTDWEEICLEWQEAYEDLEGKHDTLQDDYDALAKLQFARLTEKK